MLKRSGPTLIEIVEAGIFNTINPPYWQRDAAFWFLMGWVAQLDQ